MALPRLELDLHAVRQIDAPLGGIGPRILYGLDDRVGSVDKFAQGGPHSVVPAESDQKLVAFDLPAQQVCVGDQALDGARLGIRVIPLAGRSLLGQPAQRTALRTQLLDVFLVRGQQVVQAVPVGIGQWHGFLRWIR